MADIGETIVAGVRLARRYWRLAIPLYMVSLLLGALQTWPLLVLGGSLSGPFLSDLAGGSWESMLDLWLANQGGTAQVAAFWILATIALLALYSLAYNFFSGGILASYAAAEAEYSPRTFFEACRHWLGSFIILGAILVVLGLLMAALGGALGSLFGGAGTLIGALVGLQFANIVGEFARALAVVRERRNPFVLLGMAIGFVLRNALAVVALALVGALLGLALTALYGAVAGALGGSFILAFWQQLAVFGWLSIKLLRLAWAVVLVQRARTRNTAAESDARSMSIA